MVAFIAEGARCAGSADSAQAPTTSTTSLGPTIAQPPLVDVVAAPALALSCLASRTLLTTASAGVPWRLATRRYVQLAGSRPSSDPAPAALASPARTNGSEIAMPDPGFTASA